jgi:hypothetical protein
VLPVKAKNIIFNTTKQFYVSTSEKKLPGSWRPV